MDTWISFVCYSDIARLWTPIIIGVGLHQVVSLSIYPDAFQHMIDNHPRENPDEQNFSTSLHFATIAGHLNVVELLVQNGADVNKPDENRNTPLHLAAHHGQLDIAHLLLKSGSSINLQDRAGSTPLHKAAENGHLDIVTLLITVAQISTFVITTIRPA